MLATTEQIKNQLIPRLENKFHNYANADSSDSFVTYSALSSVLSTIQGGNYDSNISSSISSLSAAVSGLSTKVDSINTSNFVTNSNFNKLSSNVASLSAKVAAIDTDDFVTDTEFNSSIAGLSSRIDEIDFDTSTFVTNATFSALSAQVATNAANIASLSMAYVGSTAPADFNGIFFKII